MPPPADTIARFTRDEFLTRRWQYKPGDHVTILGPTGSGKTMLAYDLLRLTARPRTLPGVVLVMKPKDRPLLAWSKAAGFRRVRSWPPPPPWPWEPQHPRGWTVWPRHTFDPDIDDAHMHRLFRAVILARYKRGNTILFADEVFGLAKELGLERVLNAVWMRGRSQGLGLWAASQRPAHIPLHAYSAAQHLFIANDPDERTRERYAEIGGTDPKMILRVTDSLGSFEWLYLRRAVRGQDARRCVIEAS
jgi:ABC-type dipeptide/oligopeptide/nickel transport system ATPase component